MKAHLVTGTINSPAVACPTFDEFIERYGGKILREEVGDIQIDGGDLAMTRDFDLMLGDKVYDAMQRLAEEWRHKTPHLIHLFELSSLMIQRETEVEERLEAAEKVALSEGCSPFQRPQSPEFQKAWQAHFDEEAAAQSGRDVYPGCIVLMSSYALSRFRDDIGCEVDMWQTAGPSFNGHSIGQILVASANGVRHQDDWFKTHPPTQQQLNSIKILNKTLGEQGVHNTLSYSAGRCEEVIGLIGQDRGYDGFTNSIFKYANEIAENCRAIG